MGSILKIMASVVWIIYYCAKIKLEDLFEKGYVFKVNKLLFLF